MNGLDDVDTEQQDDAVASLIQVARAQTAIDPDLYGYGFATGVLFRSPVPAGIISGRQEKRQACGNRKDHGSHGIIPS